MSTSELSTWMKKHEGPLLGALGLVLGATLMVWVDVVHVKEANAASTNWETVFNNWKSKKETEWTILVERSRNEFNKAQAQVNLQHGMAISTATSARSKAEDVDRDVSDARKDLEQLKALSEEIQRGKDDLHQKVVPLVMDALQEDGKWSSLVEQIKKDAPLSAPLGCVIAWPFEGRPSNGDWMVCDGKELTIKGHEAVAKLLNTTYGTAATPQTHVKLPNFQGMFLRGHGTLSAPIGTKQPDLHTFEKLGDIVPNGGTFFPLWHPNRGVGREETRPVNYAVNWIIRVK